MTDTTPSFKAGRCHVVFDNPARRNALGAASSMRSKQHWRLCRIDTGADITSSRAHLRGRSQSILDGSLSGDRFQTVTNQIAAPSIPTVAVLTGNVFAVALSSRSAVIFDWRGRDQLVPAAAIGLCYPVEGIDGSRAGWACAGACWWRLKPSALTSCWPCILSTCAPPDILQQAARSYAESLLTLAPMAVAHMLGLSAVGG